MQNRNPFAMFTLSLLLAMAWAFCSNAAEEAGKIHVLVWDEQQPAQKQAYGENFLGGTIAAHLEKLPGITVDSVSIQSPEQGLDAKTLDKANVIIWWGHVQHDKVSPQATEEVVKRVMEGKLSLIALHSAHFAPPFMRLMQERAKLDAPLQIPEAERATAKFDFALHWFVRSSSRMLRRLRS